MIYAFDDASLHWTHRHDYPQPLPQPSDYDYALTEAERSDRDNNKKKNQARQYEDSQQPFLWTRNSLEQGAQQYPITDSDIMDTLISPQEVSPLGSELGSLPLPDMSPRNIIPHQQQQQQPHVVDSSSSSSAWKEYTQLWRQLIEDSSLFNFNSFTSSNDQQVVVQGLGLDAEPTPPLDLEISPVVHFAPEPSADQAAGNGNGSTNSRSTISTLTSATVELVAPKPRRLVNPAIHLAALVEEDDNNSVTASRTAGTPEEDVQERDREIVVVPEETQEDVRVVVPAAMYSGHSLEELREYMSDSEHSSSGEMVIDDQEECGFDTISSLGLPASSEPSSDAFNFDGWSFPQEGYYYPATYQAPLPASSQEVAPLPPSSCGPSPLHTIAPQYNNSRPTQLREAMRERRAARHVLHTHSRHASLPDVQYRPAKWNPNLNLNLPVPMMPSEPAPVHHYFPQQHARTAVLAPHRRRERDASRSVDWSALASQNMVRGSGPFLKFDKLLTA